MTSLLIAQILEGNLPTTPQAVKDAIDHCHFILADCDEVVQDPEVQEHEKPAYRTLRQCALAALQTLKRIRL